MIAALACAIAIQSPAETYAVDHLEAPKGAILEVGGMDWLDADRLVVSTRRGQVWIVEHALDPDPAAARFKLFCEGLQEGLGLKVVKGEIYVLQRAELSRLRDNDGDGTCDAIDTLSNDFGVSGNYHEFAFGLPLDKEGNFCIALNLGFTEPKWWHGRSLAPWRGWVLKIAPDGTTTPFASGFRSPCGIGTNAVGDLFVTDNQGDWMPACPLVHVKQGGFYGAPASLVWTDAYKSTSTEPSLTNPVDVPRTPPACWIPYKWSRSTGDMRHAPRDGSFGPFEDQLILAELTNGLVLRADLEKVRGEYQGAVFLLAENVGSAVRTLFGRDGTLLLGLTNRGWGGRAPGHGIARVRWNKVAPFEVKHVRLKQDGFELELTEPLSDAKLAPENFDVSQYHYDWWWEYGSPERDDGKRVVSAVEIANDRRSLVFKAPIAAGHMARVVLKNVVSASERPLAHPEFAYTINQLPEGPLCTTPIARVAPPPPARATQDEGWLRLTYGDALDMWREKEGWKLVDAELDAKNPTRFEIREGNGALVNTSDAEQSFVSAPEFGDGQVRFAVMLAEDSATTLYVQGRYPLVLVAPSPNSNCDPIEAAFLLMPGLWHEVELDFRAPRFDVHGKRITKACFDDIRIDGEVVEDHLDLGVPQGAPFHGEVPRGPLIFSGTPNNVALADVRVKPAPIERGDDWKSLLEDDGLDGWRSTKAADWKREDGVLGVHTAHSRLVSERSDFTQFRLHAKAKIGSGSAAWLIVRAPSAPDAADGIAVLLNADHPLRQRTGSVFTATRAESTLPVAAPRYAGLIGADTWFDLDLDVRNTADDKAVQVDVLLNGVLVNTATVPRTDALGGSIAIENHHDGSVLEISTLAVQEIDATEHDRSPR